MPALAGRPVVAVIGPAHDVRDDSREQAVELGRLLARRGVVVVTGGLGGVMAAVAQGVRESDGLALGLLPGTDRTAGNEFLSVAVPTGLGEARNALVVAAADAVISIGGSWGTLSEIALARRTGKLIVSIGGWQVGDEFGRPMPLVTAASAGEAVRLVADALGWSPEG